MFHYLPLLYDNQIKRGSLVYCLCLLLHFMTWICPSINVFKGMSKKHEQTCLFRRVYIDVKATALWKKLVALFYAQKHLLSPIMLYTVLY